MNDEFIPPDFTLRDLKLNPYTEEEKARIERNREKSAEWWRLSYLISEAEDYLRVLRIQQAQIFSSEGP